MSFDLNYLIAQWPALLNGLGMTVLVSVIALVASVVIGVIGAACRVLRVPVLSQLVVAYVELIRNTPILVQLFFIFYGLPSIGVQFSLFWSGVVCLSVWAGAYQVENIRGGLSTVEHGMREAAISLRLSTGQYLRLVALPIAFRSSLPALVNTSVSMLKNSSYLQAIGLAELTYVAVDRIATDFRALEMFAAIGVMYVSLVVLLSLAAQRLEHRLHRPFRT